MSEFMENPAVKMRIRPHRGSLDKSLAEVEEIPKTMEAILGVLNKALADWVGEITADRITLSEVKYDSRIDWHYRWVVIQGFGPWGMIDDRPAPTNRVLN